MDIFLNKNSNLVTEFKFDEITGYNIAIGPYPQTIDDVEKLANYGVTSVLWVQSKHDFKHRGINFNKMKANYKEYGIQFAHSPIHDYNQEDLIDKLQGWADELSKLVSEVEGIAYVHCTAGV